MFHSGGNGGNDVGICVSENWRIAGRYDKGSDLRLQGSLSLLFLLCSQSECLRLLSEDISERINIQLKRDVFDAVLDQDMIQFTSNNSGMYLSILNSDVTNLENNYFAKIPEIIQRSFVFLGCLAVSLLLRWPGGRYGSADSVDTGCSTVFIWKCDFRS